MRVTAERVVFESHSSHAQRLHETSYNRLFNTQQNELRGVQVWPV